MRIGITCYPTYGGSGVVATELGVGLAKRGHEVHFITYRWPFRLAGFHCGVHYHQVTVPEYPLFIYPPYCLALSVKMAEVARAARLQVLHVHYAIPHAAAAFMARQMVTPSPRVITTLHGTDITLVGNDPSFHAIVKFSTEASDGITAVSRYLAQLTRERFEMSRPIEVIHNFVDPQRFHPDDGFGERFFGDQKILMHISNFRPVKRIGDVIEIFHRVHQAMPCQLMMIGDGPEREAAEALVGKLNLESDVRFLGNQVNVDELLAQAHLFLLPSDRESFGLAALEAMSCGVPVIGCQAGGLTEVVLDGETGFLAPVGDVQAMSEFALRILGDEELRKQMGEKARQRALETFNAEDVIPRYEELYRQVVSG